MNKYLTDKQLAQKNQGFNSNRAGESLLAFCNKARAQLTSKLVKPSLTDELAFEAFISAKAAIRNMDHNGLRAALKAA